MMSRLDAEAQLAAIDATALGTGSYDPQVARELRRGLRAAADGVDQKPARVVSPEQLGAVGIGVRPVPPQKGLSDGG